MVLFSSLKRLFLLVSILLCFGSNALAAKSEDACSKELLHKRIAPKQALAPSKSHAFIENPFLMLFKKIKQKFSGNKGGAGDGTGNAGSGSSGDNGGGSQEIPKDLVDAKSNSGMGGRSRPDPSKLTSLRDASNQAGTVSAHHGPKVDVDAKAISNFKAELNKKIEEQLARKVAYSDQPEEELQQAKKQMHGTALDALHKMQKLIEEFEATKKKIKSFPELKETLAEMYKSGNKEFIEALREVEAFLEQMNQDLPLQSNEQELLSQTKEKLKKIQDADRSKIAEKFGQLILNVFSENLTTQFLASKFKSGDVWNWDLMMRHFENGSLRRLLAVSLLDKANKVLLMRSFIPYESWAFNGAEVRISEGEPHLVQARSLDDIELFYRDGVPLKYDVPRLFSGDLLQGVYQDLNRIDETLFERPRIVTIIKLDISTSMDSAEKHIFRDAMAAAFLNMAIEQKLNGVADHVIYIVPFNVAAVEERRLETLEQFQAEFNKLVGTGIPQAGGTNITEVFRYSFGKVAQHQTSGGDAMLANILIVSDGEDTINIDAVREARKQISGEVKIAVNAINIGEKNATLEQITERPLDTELDIEKLTYQHVPYTEVARILDTAKLVAKFKELAQKEVVSDFRESIAEQEVIDLARTLASALSDARATDMEAYAKAEDLSQRLFPIDSGHDLNKFMRNGRLAILIESLIAVVNSSATAALVRHEKAVLLDHGLIQIAKTFGTSRNDIIDQMDKDQKTKLYEFMKKDATN